MEDRAGQNVRGLLLRAGTEEFLEKGYRGASVRNICSRVGVTTGALYFFFRNKRDLLENIVKGSYEHLLDMLQLSRERELSDISSSERNESEILEYLIHHRKEIKLLFDCAGETKYRDFGKILEKQLQEGFLEFYEKQRGQRADPELIRILVKMRMAGYLELIDHDYPLPLAKALVQKMRIYAESGFLALLREE